MNEFIGLLTTANTEIPLTGVRVEGDLAGRGARLTVRQTYRNTEKQAVEAVYKFPLPESGAIAGFRIRIGEKRIEGAVDERDLAFERYDNALIRGDGAYLMDEERPNIFTISAGNLNPGMEAAIEIDLVMLMDFEGNKYRLTLPNTIAPRYVPADMPDEDGIPADALVNPVYAPDVPYGLSLMLRIHHSGKLAAVESPSHPVRVKMEKKQTTVELTSDTTKMDRDFVMIIDPGEKTGGKAVSCSDGRHAFWQLDLNIPEPESGQKPDPGEVVFLLDCSGSMQGESIDQAKKALEICLKALPAGCTFNIYRFGSSFNALFKEPQPYSETSLTAALRGLERTNANLGGTEMYAPFEAIYQAHPNDNGRSIILLTDGETGNEQQLLDLVSAHRAGTRVYPIGIGAGPNEHLIKGLARAGDGTAEFVFPGERIEPKVLRLFSRIGGPVISGLRIHWADARAEQAPARQPVFAGRTATFFARGNGKRKDQHPVKVTGTIDEKPVEWVFDVEQISSGNMPLPQLWARERIRDLEELSPESGSQQLPRREHKYRSQIIEISRAYSILSRFTSYLGIEQRDGADRTTGPVELRKVPALITTGWHGGMIPDTIMPCISGLDLASDAGAPVHDNIISEISYFRKTVHDISYLGKEITDDRKNRTDILMTLLGTQQISGGFLIDEKTAGRLGIDLTELKKQAEKLQTAGRKNAFLLVCTVLVFEILRVHFAGHSSTWQPVAEKSRKWLEQQMDADTAPETRRALAGWAKKFAADQINYHLCFFLFFCSHFVY